MREEKLGTSAAFLIPSLGLKRRTAGHPTVEDEIHEFLMSRFGGYTAAAGNIFGYWRSPSGKESYGEHREFRVGIRDGECLAELKEFLARIARRLGEESIYLETGGEALLIFAASSA